jgi:hypothetical protein
LCQNSLSVSEGTGFLFNFLERDEHKANLAVKRRQFASVARNGKICSRETITSAISGSFCFAHQKLCSYSHFSNDFALVFMSMGIDVN